MVLSSKRKIILTLGSAVAVSPLVLWGVSVSTFAIAFVGVVAFGVAAGLLFGRTKRA